MSPSAPASSPPLAPHRPNSRQRAAGRRWHAKAREIYARAISFQTVQGRNASPRLAAYLEEQFRAGGLTGVTIHPHDETAALVLRWPAARPSGRKAILLMAHMDVVEARREDWSRDPFTLTEEGGYFYGRGTLDDKQGVTAITTALLRLRAEGFQPGREIIVLFTGDEETTGNGAELAASQWLDTSTIEFALNGDAGGGAFLADGTLLGFGIQTAEKTYQSYTLTATIPAGTVRAHARQCHLRARPHTGRPSATASRRCRTRPRAAISPTARPPRSPLAAASARLANPADDEAADLIEASPTESA